MFREMSLQLIRQVIDQVATVAPSKFIIASRREILEKLMNFEITK